MKHVSRLTRPLVCLTAAAWLATCGGGSGGHVVSQSFAPVDPLLDVLQPAEIDDLVMATAQSIDSALVSIAVTDRVGNVLRIWNRTPSAALSDYDNKIAVSLARAAALASHSQAPFASRTVQATGTFHFPAQFDGNTFEIPFDVNSTVQTEPTVGLENTLQGPCWQWDASNRGAKIASALTTPPTSYAPGQDLPQLTNPDGSVPSPGLSPLPGGLPLYKRAQAALASPGSFDVERRLVGGLGVFVQQTGSLEPDPAASEYAAWIGVRSLNAGTGEDYTFAGIPSSGAVFLEGVLLPYVAQTSAPAGVGPGTYSAADTVFDSGTSGSADPSGYLIDAHSSLSAAAFAALEVDAVIQACATTAGALHSAVRLPAKSSCRVVIAVTDVEGVILGLFRMEDASVSSVDLALAKARTARLYSDPAVVNEDGPFQGLHPLFGILPAGTAITTRTLSFLSQPFFPPGIDSTASDIDTLAPFDPGSGPLYELACENRKPFRFNQMGFAPAAPIDPLVQDDSQNGVAFCAGGVALYRNGALIGGLGIAGDGPGQEDWIALKGIQAAQTALGFTIEAPPAIRADQFQVQGVSLPYFKLPQNPGG